ncbi:MAG: hypothetical protein QOG34_2533 [Frankiaceae bacterium]|jgi:hypothetical protein|nr:hypothetical protein [Frankiaceae bacterium]
MTADDGRATSIADAVRRSLEDTPHLPRDKAAIALLLHYADLLDDATDRLDDAAEEGEHRDFGRMVMAISKIGPRVEAMLDRLGMSPGARPAKRDGDPDAAGAAGEALQELEQRAAARAAGQPVAPAVDPAVAKAIAGE